MTQEQYERQIQAIREVTAEICKSPEAARQYLIDAGIYLKDKPKKKQRRSRIKKKTG